MAPVRAYLAACARIHRLPGTDERSFGPALSELLNAIGGDLRPAVTCVMELQNQGQGHPDGGLFTPDQQVNPQGDSDAPLFAKAASNGSGPIPARGAIEVKPPTDSLDALADSDQVARYLSRYGTVLLTNLRDFRLVGTPKGNSGHPETLESFTVADSDAAFWTLCNAPTGLDDATAERFRAFLQRVMLRGAPLQRPEDVAWLLASYARDAKIRLDDASLDDLSHLRGALEDALGITFSGDRGERFFRSTIIQTLFYGVFSAWVLWHRERPTRTDAFDWTDAAEYLHVPVLETLFYQLVQPSQLRRLRIRELLDWTGDALSRVDRAAFFERFRAEEAVQYFYEPFLEAFDPDLRKQLGVWYTPREIVRYMVGRVDTVLKEELEIPDGLADERVTLLDPCTGTAAYLVAVMEHLETHFQQQGYGDMTGVAVKNAMQGRVYGFEILTAPFVVAHLQIGLKLAQMGAPLEGSERAGVYLTNALTGWNPPEEPQTILFPDLQHEREQADAVKQEEDILVILGNPPYDGYAGIAVDEERGLSEAYRESPEGVPDPRGQGLNDLYVRFYRMAERQIAENSGRGIVCYISNYSWLDALSHPGMRARYLEAFDRIWIDNLHGDRKISERNPDGESSQTIFSITGQSAGIRVGTAIGLLCRSEEHNPNTEADVHYRDFHEARADERRAALIRSLQDGGDGYAPLEPNPTLGLPFKPRTTAGNYLDWPTLPELFPTSFPGVKTSRDDAVVDVDRDALVERMKAYFDPDVPDAEIEARCSRLMHSTRRFDAEAVRETLQERGFLPDNVVRHCYRPMDVRWLYWEPETDLLDRERADYAPHVFEGNRAMVSQQKPRREWSPAQVIESIGCLDLMDRGASCIPMYLHPDVGGGDLFSQSDGSGEPTPNLSGRAERYLQTHGETVETLFYHAIAAMHAPTYQQENEGALRQDWPRIPLPGDTGVLQASAALGREVAALLDVETGVPGVDSGTIRDELQPLGQPEHVEDGRSLRTSDFAVTAGWGYTIRETTVMPNNGTLEKRPYTPDEEAALPTGIREHWGTETLDIYWNEDCRWTNVPARIWSYTLGGYPVIKKWLSYREKKVIGRDLTFDEIRHVQHMTRRIAALLQLEPRLEANYDAVKEAVPGNT
jgi:hypothetical protein